MLNHHSYTLLGCLVALSVLAYQAEALLTNKDYPFMVHLRYPGKNTVCSGILLSTQHVLTASHCVEYKYDYKKMTVVAGARTRLSCGVVRRISQVFYHPGNDIEAGETNKDVAILKLKAPFKFGPTIQPMTKFCSANAIVAEKVKFVGWAEAIDLNDEPLKKVNQTLQGVDIPIISLKECSQKFSSIMQNFYTDIVESNTCAYSQRYNSCVVNGGSAVLRNEDTLCGVNSWCLGCGEGNYPSVYTRIDKVIGFIQESLAK